MSDFILESQDGQARAGTLKTEHGDIETPIFMPVGTRASVKSLWQEELEELGAQIILGNTYHLLLRPGPELIETMGGLHGFMAWDHPILTDSGGFQIFSLNDLNKIEEEGVTFKSHIDGKSYFVGPEESMKIQRALGSDIVMAFDECPALPNSAEKLRDAVERTLRWAKRGQSVSMKPHQKVFGIVQGGLDLELRKECLERLKELDFPGYAIGGLSVGEKNQEMVELCRQFAPEMPKDKPRYLMGVGTPMDIMVAIKNGIDMFDCVLPTRNARNGQALTSQGPISIKKQKYEKDSGPLDPNCDCKVCQKYSRSYIRHLYKVGEYLAGQMLSYHNLHYYLSLVKGARKAIKNQQFDEYFQAFYNQYSQKEG